LQNSV